MVTKTSSSLDDTLQLMAQRISDAKLLDLDIDEVVTLYQKNKDDEYLSSLYYAIAFYKMRDIMWKLFLRYWQLDEALKVEKAMWALWQCLNRYQKDWKGNESRQTKGGGKFSTQFYAECSFRLYDEYNLKLDRNKLPNVTVSLDELLGNANNDYDEDEPKYNSVEGKIAQEEEIHTPIDEKTEDHTINALSIRFNFTEEEKALVSHLCKNKVVTQNVFLYDYYMNEDKNDCPHSILKITKRTRGEVLEEQLKTFENWQETLRSVTKKLSSKKLEAFKKERQHFESLKNERQMEMLSN